MNRKPWSQMDDGTESSSSSLLAYSPSAEESTDNTSTTPLPGSPAIRAPKAFLGLKPAFFPQASFFHAAHSLQLLARRNLGRKRLKDGPTEPPSISESVDAVVNFMGYEHVSKTAIAYDFVMDELLPRREVTTEPQLGPLMERIWDWIDWLWMRRRNCKVCVEVIRALRSGTASRTEWESGREICKVRELLPSVRSCGLCAVLHGGLSPTEQKKVDSHSKRCLGDCLTTFICSVIWQNGEREVSLRLRHVIDGRPLWVEVKLLRRSDFKPFDCSGASVLRHLGYSTHSTQALVAALNWHRECTQGHKDCRRANPTYLPSRLIDIGKYAFSYPHLVLAHELERGTKYATLSHCWGRSDHARLSSSNLSAYRQRLPRSGLSKTFKEALTITRYLGLRYLWIDSLCIIQDSEKDWAKESSEMSRIYSNGSCNIAASSSLDGSEGLFHPRNPLAIRPTKIPLTREDTKLGKRYWAVNAQVWQRNVEGAPLNRRGWVCQERLLSPCTLHFGIDQLYWECRTQTCCEFYPTGLPFIVPGVSKTKALFAMIESQLLNNSSDHDKIAVDGYRLWDDIVEKYSRSTLSFDTDKLVAVAGLAAEIYRIVNDQYCAGLWRKHFLSQLLWRVKLQDINKEDQPAVLPKTLQYIAPSWSWASVQSPVGAVYFDPKTDYPVAEVLDIKLDLVNPSDKFGALQKAAVKLRGRLAKAILGKRKRGGLRLKFSPNFPKPLRWMLDSSSPIPLDSISCIYNFQNSKARLTIYPNSHTSLEATAINAKTASDSENCLYFFLLRMSTRGSYAGLILKQYGEDRTTFERWGSFETSDIQEPEPFEHQFTNFDNGCLDEGLDFRDGGNGGCRYDVTLV